MGGWAGAEPGAGRGPDDDRDLGDGGGEQVKLSPSDIDGWNALGHCFWKKGDLQGAVGCYQEALQKVREEGGAGTGREGGREARLTEGVLWYE